MTGRSPAPRPPPRPALGRSPRPGSRLHRRRNEWRRSWRPVERIRRRLAQQNGIISLCLTYFESFLFYQRINGSQCQVFQSGHISSSRHFLPLLIGNWSSGCLFPSHCTQLLDKSSRFLLRVVWTKTNFVKTYYLSVGLFSFLFFESRRYYLILFIWEKVLVHIAIAKLDQLSVSMQAYLRDVCRENHCWNSASRRRCGQMYNDSPRNTYLRERSYLLKESFELLPMLLRIRDLNDLYIVSRTKISFFAGKKSSSSLADICHGLTDWPVK